MVRQKKFYAWGYADEELTTDEIRSWEGDIARHYNLSAFDGLRGVQCVWRGDQADRFVQLQRS